MQGRIAAIVEDLPFYVAILDVFRNHPAVRRVATGSNAQEIVSEIRAYLPW
jgi:hypothetical protein